MSLKAGELLAQRYLLLKRLGGGTLTRSYLATDQTDAQPVVIKELTLSSLSAWKPYELFQREAQTLAALRHPQIPALLDSFQEASEDDTRFYLVTRYIEGQSLAECLEQGRRWQESELIEIARQILEILSYLHALVPPVIHRDLKPANLILDPEGRIYLVDFGAVQAAELSQGSGATVVGTFGYMAPEQFAGRATAASDLYALGASLLQLISGRPPAEFSSPEQRLSFRSQLTCSAALISWLESLLDPVPERRPADARAALKSLDLKLQPLVTEAGQGLFETSNSLQPPQAPEISALKQPRLSLDLEAPFLRLNQSAYLRPLSGALGLFAGSFSLSLALFRSFGPLWGLLELSLSLGILSWMIAWALRSVQLTLTPQSFKVSVHYAGFAGPEYKGALSELEEVKLTDSWLVGTQTLTLRERKGKKYRFANLPKNQDLTQLQAELASFRQLHAPETLKQLE